MEKKDKGKRRKKKKMGAKEIDFWLHKAGFIRKPEGIILPFNHPAADLRPGEYKIKDGVIIEYFPDGTRETPLVAGIPEEDQPGILAAPFHLDKSDDLDALLKNRLDLASWSAGYSGKYLPKKAKRELKDLYFTMVEESLNINVLIASGELEEKEALEKSAELMQSMILQEHAIFRPHKKAQKHRYGHLLESEPPDSSVEENLKNAVLHFISGDYLKDQAEREENPQNERFRPGKDFAKWKEIFGELSWLEYFSPKEPVGIEVVGDKVFLVLEDPPYGYGYDLSKVELAGPWEKTYEHDLGDLWVEAKKFITTHTGWGPIGALISNFLPNWLTGLVHTNFVAGIWKGKLSLIVESREVFFGASTWHENRICFIYEEEHEWVIANGNGSTYKEDDNVIDDPKYHKVFKDVDTARRYLLSVRKDDDGNYYANQAAAYSVGQYGINWVCHQNLNAFTFRKWNETPFYHPLSMFKWGPYGTGHSCSGDEPISPAKDSEDEDIEHPGGAPGPSCLYYHDDHPLPLISCALGAQCNLMSGWGYGLTKDPYTDWLTGQTLSANAICDNPKIPPDFTQLIKSSPPPLKIVAAKFVTP
jgi:hypothetical protein